MKRRVWVASAVVTVAVAAFATARFAGAGDEPPAKPAGKPQPQKRIDHPFVKAIEGTWSVSADSPYGPSSGTAKFSIGVGGTAVLEDYEAGMGPMGTFYGHGIYKVSADGKTLDLWWVDVHSAAVVHYSGALTDHSYDVKSDEGTRFTLEKKDAGFEFKYYAPDGTVVFTDKYARK